MRPVFWRRLCLRVIVFVNFRGVVFVGTTVNDRLKVEVAVTRWARGLPLEAVGVPRVSADALPEEHAVEEINDEENLAGDEQDRRDGHEDVDVFQVLERVPMPSVG